MYRLINSFVFGDDLIELISYLHFWVS
ncbi:unnamed protein product, partial [Rotaria sp. Silwood2]